MAVLEREETMRSLVDMQKKLELRYQRERERHTLRVQERLTIIQNRKSDDDLLGIKNLSAFTQEEDEQLQKMLVRERLEQLRRERSYILQTRRERNTAGFKELLGPTAQHSLRTED
ncbi:uncharacterized protein LOC134094474 [Sardina pilchardus]|uniref:uncharacterized protein LOC134094474 n=1 Tax=Sardina pilchardus TaxID=27697 RepID=UPI002E15097C